MARKIIQPDLRGRENAVLHPRQERLRAVQSITNMLTAFGVTGVVLLGLALIPAVADQMAGWPWRLLETLGLAAAFVLSAIRIKLKRWSWIGFAAALAAHGVGLSRCRSMITGDPEGRAILASEVLLLALLLGLHAWWSLLAWQSRGDAHE